MTRIHPYSLEEHADFAAKLREADTALGALVAMLDSERLRIRQRLKDRARRLVGELTGLRFDFSAECQRQHPLLRAHEDPYRSVAP